MVKEFTQLVVFDFLLNYLDVDNSQPKSNFIRIKLFGEESHYQKLMK